MATNVRTAPKTGRKFGCRDVPTTVVRDQFLEYPAQIFVPQGNKTTGIGFISCAFAVKAQKGLRDLSCTFDKPFYQGAEGSIPPRDNDD